MVATCLQEVQLCRPYFLGMLGQRYGWIPDPEDLAEVCLQTLFFSDCYPSFCCLFRDARRPG